MTGWEIAITILAGFVVVGWFQNLFDGTSSSGSGGSRSSGGSSKHINVAYQTGNQIRVEYGNGRVTHFVGELQGYTPSHVTYIDNLGDRRIYDIRTGSDTYAS